MLVADPKNAEVIFPYLDGDDLKSVPEQLPTRWVINFWDWPEDRAREYTLPYAWLENHVKAERLAKNDRGAREKWWLPLRARPELYHAIGRGQYFEQHPEGWDAQTRSLEYVLVAGRVGKYFNPSVVTNDSIFHEKCVVFALEDVYAYAALFNSSPVDAWVWKHSSRMKLDLNFSPSDAIETFPFLKSSDINCLDKLGREYLQARREVMMDSTNPIGLTKLYNRFHNVGDGDSRIHRLRELHREIDAAVMRVYGWNDLDLGHGYHEQQHLAANDRVRFTISESARVEVLRRFAELNRHRYEEEVAQGLHADAMPRATKRTNSVATVQPSFDFETVIASGVSGSAPISSILGFLGTHDGWHAKADILAATGITNGQWNAVITALISDGRIERQGERRGARYRIQPSYRDEHHKRVS
nr:hypothetical protein [Paraburkholderia adhaesiva]